MANIYKTIDGFKYGRWSDRDNNLDPFWMPEEPGNNAPMICNCGSKHFIVTHPQAYSTCCECVQCGAQMEVHSG